MKKIFLILVILTFNLYAQVTPQQVTTKMIKDRIDNLIGLILEEQRPDGSWNYSGHVAGSTALHLLALSTAGLTDKHPAVQKGIAYLQENFPENDTYSIGMYACAFQAIDQAKYKNEIKKAADWLKNHQVKGTWNYSGNNSGDNSVTQFAILGLKAAQDAGIDIPKTVFKSTATHFETTQNKDGGWGYTGRSRSSPSMTAAALASLSVCEVEIEDSLEILKGPRFCGLYKDNKTIAGGINWIVNEMDTKSPATVFSEPYTAYAVERVGIFFDQKFLGKYDWYRHGSATILNNNVNNGYYVPKAFKLLFLAKGNTPLLFNKIQWGKTDDWNRRHRDVLHCIKSLSKIFEQQLDWQTCKLDLNDKKFGQAPILYISGLKDLQMTEEEKLAFKSFVDDGGTVVLSPCLKSKEFITSTLKSLKDIFPGSRFEDLPRGHDLRRMFYDLKDIRLPLKVFMNNCSYKRIFLLTEDISFEFEKKEPEKITLYTMTNLAKYALKEKPLVGKLDVVEIIKAEKENVEEFSFEKADGADAAGLDITQILYGNEPELTDPESMNNQLGFMRQTLKIPTTEGISLLSLKEKDKLKIKPVLFMTGNKEFKLSKEELNNLKEYLDNGGFLFADSRCSCDEFDKSFRELLKQIYPKQQLEVIPLETPVYQSPFKHAVEFTEELKKEKDEKKPFLLGIRQDERYVVIYSPLDFSSALANKMDENSKGIKSPSAFKIVTNIITYGLSY